MRNTEFQRKIYSVSELCFEIRDMLERRFIDIWVEGELSNFKTSTAGHLYFTLKDDRAQLPAVCFRNAARLLRFRPENGKLFRFDLFASGANPSSSLGLVCSTSAIRKRVARSGSLRLAT